MGSQDSPSSSHKVQEPLTDLGRHNIALHRLAQVHQRCVEIAQQSEGDGQEEALAGLGKAEARASAREASHEQSGD